MAVPDPHVGGPLRPGLARAPCHPQRSGAQTKEPGDGLPVFRQHSDGQRIWAPGGPWGRRQGQRPAACDTNRPLTVPSPPTCLFLPQAPTARAAPPSICRAAAGGAQPTLSGMKAVPRRKTCEREAPATNTPRPCGHCFPKQGLAPWTHSSSESPPRGRHARPWPRGARGACKAHVRPRRPGVGETGLVSSALGLSARPGMRPRGQVPGSHGASPMSRYRSSESRGRHWQEPCGGGSHARSGTSALQAQKPNPSVPEASHQEAHPTGPPPVSGFHTLMHLRFHLQPRLCTRSFSPVQSGGHFRPRASRTCVSSRI